MWKRLFNVSGPWLALSLTVSASALGATINPGDILVADFSALAGFTGGVIQVTPATGAQTTVSSGGSFADPTGIAIAPNGDIIVVEETAFGSGGVIRVNPATGSQTTIASAGGFVNPRGITIAPNGDIYIADYGTVGGSGAITKIDGVTSVRTVVASGGLLVDPIGMAFAPNGDLFVADFYFDNGIGRIVKLAAGTFTQSLVTSGGSLVDPHGIAIASNGDLLVSDLDAFTGALGGIIRIDPTTGVQTTLSSGGYFVDPSGLAVASDGAILVADYAAVGGTGTIVRVDPSDGSQTMAFPGGVFVDPIAIAVAPGTPQAPSSDLTVAGPLLTALPTTYTSVVVSSGGVFTADAHITVTGNVTIESGGALTHSARLVSGLVLDVTGTLDVQTGGLIDLDAKGLKGGGNGSAFGVIGEAFNDSDAIVSGAVGGGAFGAGASYGGQAPNTPQGALTNAPYGFLEDPRHLGSGGGRGGIYAGGNGGGRATITAATGILDGTIRANGQAGAGVTGGNAGGGSGGAIRLNVGNLLGTGAIQARGGGSGGAQGGTSGSGGRIAIYYDTHSFPVTNINARGGNAVSFGAAGTIYLKDNAQSRGDLLIDNAGVVASVETPLRTALTPAAFDDITVQNAGVLGPKVADISAGSYSADHLRIGTGGAMNSRMDVTLPTGAELELASGTINVMDNSVFHLGTFNPANVQSGTVSVSTGSRLNVISSSITLGSGVTLIKDGALGTVGDQISMLMIQSGGALTHSARLVSGLVLDVTGTLDVQTGGLIDLDAKGLKGGGNGSAFGVIGEAFNDSDAIVSGAVGGGAFGAGASYGGQAPNTPQGALTNAPYGFLEDPRHLGSGGGRGGIYAGGNGGGRATITAATGILDGTIRANGQAGAGVTGGNAGGGSGGAIRLNVGNLLGTGAIQARGGGSGGAQGGTSGSGGRIAIYYDTHSFPVTNINARGGNAVSFGAAGTIYLKDNAQSRGDLLIDNAGVVASVETPLRTALTPAAFDDITVQNAGVLGPKVADISAGSYSADHLRINVGGTLNLRMDLTLNNGSELDLAGGTINVLDGTVFRTGTFDASNAHSGVFNLSAGCRLDVFSNSITIGASVTLVKDGSFGIAGDEINSMTIQSGGVVTHSPRFLNGLTLNITSSLDVQSGGLIDLNAKGLRGGRNGSLFDRFGETFDTAGNVVEGAAGGPQTGAGGGYGGLGGASSDGASSNPPYGLLDDPKQLGSGGGTHFVGATFVAPGGHGGGYARISAQTFIVDGTIRANGGAGTVLTSSAVSGGGSGGAIRIDTESLSGAGLIQALGGNGGCGFQCGGSGGGGRIAIYFDEMSIPTTNLHVEPGAGGHVGALGTIFLKRATQLIILPNHGGNTDLVSVKIVGEAFTPGTTLTLTRLGNTHIEPVTLAVAANGSTLFAKFDLMNQQTGPWDVIATRPDGTSMVLPQGFNVEQGRPSRVWVDLGGRRRQLVGRPGRVTLLYGNSGNVNAYGVPLWIDGFPNDISLVPNFTVDPIPPELNNSIFDGNQAPLTYPGESTILVPLFAPEVPTGAMGVLSFTLTVPSVREFPIAAWTDPPFYQSPFHFDRAECWGSMFALAGSIAGAVPGVGCGLAFASCTANFIAGAVNNARAREAHDGTGILMTTAGGALSAAGCAAGECFGGFVPGFSQGLAVVRSFFNGIQVGRNCFGEASRSTINYQVVGAVDPNDLQGVIGYGAARYVSHLDPLRYSVIFENIPTASAPAHEVVITDQLDLNSFDPSSVMFGPVSFGDKQVVPVIGVDTDVDLRPIRDLIVRIRPEVDQSTGLLSVAFSSIDPSTGLPTEEPERGFLPPDINNPEGEGTVFFTVAPRPGLVTGSQIRNRASIRFDTNAPIETPEWVNTLDTTEPESHVQVLAESQDDPEFLIAWAGTDTGSGIRAYTVYASEDNGAFVPWINTSATSATFQGKPGSFYSFYSVATDGAFNIEAIPTTADATTRVNPPGHLSGRVQASCELPVLGAVVEILRNGASVGSVMTPATGVYEFALIQGVSYQLVVTPPEGFVCAAPACDVVSFELVGDLTIDVTVTDAAPPTITGVPQAALYACAAQVPTGSAEDVNVMDNCGPPTVTVSDSTNGGAGSAASPLVVTRTWTATDAAGNAAQAIQTITLVDDILPSITAPADVAAASGSNVDLGTPVTGDNCGVASVTSDAPPTFPEGNTTVTWTVTDTSGNQASDTQVVTVTVPNSRAEVVVATNSVWLKEHAIVHSGHVIVRDASSGPTLDSQVELAVGQGVSTPAEFELKANRIHVKQGAVVASDVSYNQLTNNGTITGAQTTPLSLPGTTLPAFEDAPAGTQDITVNANQSITLTAGAYRDILVKLSGTILFTGGGDFALRSLDTGDRATLLFDAPTTILIEGKLDTDQHSYVGPVTGSGISAADIVFYVAAVNGNNGNFGATPKAVQLGLHNTVLANVYAPNGTLWLRQGTTATGAFIGRDVIVGEQVEVTLASAFETGVAVVKAGPAIQDDQQAAETTPGIELHPNPSPFRPVAYALFQNFPDPFNPTTTLQFDLPEPADVTLEVFDVTGRQVALVIAHRRYEIGRHRVAFDARGLRSGVYFYRIQAGSFTSSKKMLLLK